MTKKKSKFGKAIQKSTEERKIPFRDIYKDGVTYSFLDEWLLDREQARLSYVEGWTSEGLSVPLDFGLAFHDCLEWLGKGRSLRSVKTKVLDPYRNNKIKFHKLLPHEKEKLDEIVEMVAMHVQEYKYYWQDYDKDFKFIYQEKSFKVDHETSTGSPIPIRGRWDGVFREDSGIWVMETKTKGQIDEEGILASLPSDLQTMMYVHCLQKHLGKPVKGVLYNVIRRPGQRRRNTESVNEYVKRVQDDVLERPAYYFMRWRVELLPGDIEQWVSRCLNPILDEVARWWDSMKDPFDPWDSPLHFQNPTALFTKYGRSRYFNLLTRNDSHGLTKRSNNV